MKETPMRLGHHSAEGCQGKAGQGWALTGQEDEQAQGHLSHDGVLAWRGVGEGPALAGPPGCHRGLWFVMPSYSAPHPGYTAHPRAERLALKAER